MPASCWAQNPTLQPPTSHPVSQSTLLDRLAWFPHGSAQKLLRELNEQYPDNELFAAAYAKAMSLLMLAAPVR